MSTPPITAIVIFRNEQDILERCLRALRWCDELIAVDMQSSDGSRKIAQQYADRIFVVPQYPIAEPTRVAAARLARNDWVLLIDPDEVVPEQLANDIKQTLQTNPDAGAVSLPMWFYFKQRQLTGTIWGRLTYKQRLIHRQRCNLLPLCNRITELREGFSDIRIDHQHGNHIQHYWSNSYCDLLHKHFRRYAHLEAKAMVAEGQRFTLKMGVQFPLTELRRCLKDFDGWRLGLRGFLLTGIYVSYVVASTWLMPYYQRKRDMTVASETPHEVPTLTEVFNASNVASRIAA